MGILFLSFDAIIRILIGIIPLRIVQWYKGSRIKAMATILGVVFLQGCVFLTMHYVFWKHFNFIHTAKSMVQLDFSYGELIYFPQSVIMCLVFAILLGFILKGVFRKNKDYIGRKNQYILTVISLTLMYAGIIFFVSLNGAKNIVITEVCSNNRNVYVLSHESYCDYVELQHTGLFVLEDATIYLSDDQEDTTKLKVEGINLQPGEYLVVGMTEDEELSISKEGENIYLFDEFGIQIDEVCSVEQEESISYSWMEAKNDWELRTCTPGEDNALSKSIIQIEAPILSHESGFYDTSFELTLSAAEDVDIYYTLDGSIPTKESAHYEAPIRVYDKSDEENVWRSIQNVVPDWKNYIPDPTPVDKAFIVRTVAYDQADNQSEVITATYFVNQEKYVKNKVVSLVADPEDLFGDNGIYVSGKEYDDWYLYGIGDEEPVPNFRKNERESEIPASFQMFEGELVANQNVGIRIQGGSNKKAAVKRFSVIARKEFSGTKWFDYELFEDKRTHSVVLREGFMNAISPYLVLGRDLTLQQAVPVDVFLNGEYWYTTYMQEKISETFLEESYGLQDENAIIVKNGNSDEEEIQEEYAQLCDFLESHDLSDGENYEKVCQQIDIQSYIDYICINTYLCNMDWDDIKNYVLWKSKETSDNPYEDGRFRWILYDMDAIDLLIRDGYSTHEIPSINSFAVKGDYVSTAVNDTVLFRNLKNNPDFCKQFVLSFMDIANTCFSEENVSAVLEEWGEDLTWSDGFFTKRKDYIFTHLEEEFDLQGSREKVVIRMNNKEAGTIVVNTATPQMTNGSWEGYYYTDYPITLSANVNSGYQFIGWEDRNGNILSSNEVIEADVTEGGIDICAVFEKEE